MAWRDQLQNGKFRDAEFLTEAVENDIGRRTALHEYPLRDKPFAEDMGKKAREFVVECFVIGDDYMSLRDKLIAALEKQGAGTLVHPYWGNQNVQVLKCRVRESSDEGRMARFSITFAEAGQNETPAENADTAAVVNNKVDAGINAGISDFSKVFSVAKMPEFVATDAVTTINSALDVVAKAPAALASVNAIRANVATAVNDPLTLAQNMTGAIAQVSDLPTLKKLATFGNDLATIAKTTASRTQQANNQQAIVALVRTASVLETARLLV